jgi:hypothetical protein
MRISVLLTLTGGAVLGVAAGAGPRVAQGAIAPAGSRVAAPRRHVPRIRGRFGTSSNWAGYAVDGSNVTDVKGKWIVPAVTLGSGCPDSYSATWLGIDGDNSNTVEQCGTDQDFINGQPVYYAWYEMYPKYPVNLSTSRYPVQPGDRIEAEVKYTGRGLFQLTLNNVGKWSFSTVQKLQQAKRTSAEWIEEAPWAGGVLPLARFSDPVGGSPTVRFTNCQAALGGAGLIGLSSLSSPEPITMVGGTNASPTVKADPGGISGDAFSIEWLNCQ